MKRGAISQLTMWSLIVIIYVQFNYPGHGLQLIHDLSSLNEVSFTTTLMMSPFVNPELFGHFIQFQAELNNNE